MTSELQTLCSVLRAAAAAQIMPRFRHTASHRKADGSLVTEADLAVQREVTSELAARYPDTLLLGEEMDTAEQQRLLDDAQTGVWCLDPVDGTSNYACGFPYFAISLALLKGGEPSLGVIFDPVRDECFCAARGSGAYCNGESLHLESESADLGDCLALVDLKRLPERLLPRLGRGSAYRSQRNLGSVALDWCWLAAGRGQLYLHGGQKLWDYAAGRLIASEAGVASRLFTPDALKPPPGLSLEPRMAVAAASASLLERWLAWLQLPPRLE